MERRRYCSTARRLDAKVELGEEQKMFTVTPEDVSDWIRMMIDNHEDRMPDDYDDNTCLSMDKAFRDSVDLVKLNAEMPTLIYPSKNFAMITKKDLL